MFKRSEGFGLIDFLRSKSHLNYLVNPGFEFEQENTLNTYLNPEIKDRENIVMLDLNNENDLLINV